MLMLRFLLFFVSFCVFATGFSYLPFGRLYNRLPIKVITKGSKQCTSNYKRQIIGHSNSQLYSQEYVDDEEEDPRLLKKILDGQIMFSLTSKGSEIFDFASSSLLTRESFFAWERQLETLVGELASLTNKDLLLSVYKSILEKASPLKLDPLQMAAFQLLANRIMDSLVSLRSPNSPVTALIDEVTDLHLNFVEKFQTMIDDGGDEG